MIHLGASASLKVITGSAVASMVMTYAYTDLNTSTGTVTPGTPTNASISGAVTTTLVAGVASTIRRVHSVQIRNTHASTSNTVTVQHDDGTTAVAVRSVTLAAGEALEYAEGRWRRIDSQGREVASSAIAASPTVNTLNTVVLSADVTGSATANAITDITGLSFSVVTGQTYWFRAVVDYTSPATTTGSRFSVNGPGSPTRLSYSSRYSLSTTSETVNHGLSAYDSPASANATSAATGANQAVVEGFITPSADGTVTIRFASEVINSQLVAKAGSILMWMRTL